MNFIFFDPYKEDIDELFEFLMLYDSYCADFKYDKTNKTFKDFLEINFERPDFELTLTY